MNNIKKLLILVSILTLSAFTLASCGGGSKGNLKTGFAVVSTIEKADDAGDEDGQIKVGSTAAAVLVDEKGVIKDCIIDVVQTPGAFSATGEITSDRSEAFISKHELGMDYDMLKASPIEKEWFEQADALAEYIIGKTLEEVKAIAVEDGAPTGADFESSVTMQVTDMLLAVEKAVNNAKDLGASADDSLGLGLISRIGGQSKDAADEDGRFQAYSHYGVVTLGKDKKITSSIIDASQTNVDFSNLGAITSETEATFESKLEKGNDYNMKDASPIGKEWFEQSEAFSEHIKGKTIAEVTSMELVEGVATDLDSSVTVTVDDFVLVIEKAGASAAK